MKLRDILDYDQVTIQCHDNPDADAIASGYALYCYCQEHQKDAVLMYSGVTQIGKDNLKIMVDQLCIPIEYWDMTRRSTEGLLITVDCQYGAKNVTKLNSDDQMIIDHHKQEIDNIEKCHIASNIGSCSTVMWQLLSEEQFPFEKYPKLQTALYYGLYMDTGQFIDINNPYDRDMRDAMNFDPILIHWLQNSNLSARELEIAGVAMLRTIINKEKRFAVVKAEPCDPNILGMISDLVMQVSEIDSCVVFCVFDHGIKYSVRSCVKEIRADHMARMLSLGIGSGGGHSFKAGGYINGADYQTRYGDVDQASFFTDAMKKYLDSYDILDTLECSFDLTDSEYYQKNKIRLGYVVASEILPPKTETVIRTLEGDLTVSLEEGVHIMIGVMGEIYPISGAKFAQNYRQLEERYEKQLPYHPKAKVIENGVEYSLLDHARTCESTDSNVIVAKKLTKGVKLFTAWDRDTYMLGEVGDYLAAKADDLNDMYIIRKDIFELTYRKLEKNR